MRVVCLSMLFRVSEDLQLSAMLHSRTAARIAVNVRGLGVNLRSYLGDTVGKAGFGALQLALYAYSGAGNLGVRAFLCGGTPSSG